MVIPNTLTANLYVSLIIQLVVLPFMNSIQGEFQTLALIPLLSRNVLYKVSTCYLGLRDHQICLQLNTYGISLDDNSSIYRSSIDSTSTTSMEFHTAK